ncbi:transmembrane protein, putative (macronuclear) [Tetrahymena thermophila SB210]|uniref:Transmembrane protein, putative n=1 Tax=Tetrahymena thermophila (strain SB210) TaxID=312017 RepID=W7X4S1_TETTS|nr:transmembrane protein, putative [Tetrahymena thermophila SB210]EWS74315.1 transmembrane protein, putative [Tetrahymena thermophila SB210]|eukprot:XP_012653136.1 transmembrane protein, putative [Tetrahymena thermophila SB210]
MIKHFFYFLFKINQEKINKTQQKYNFQEKIIKKNLMNQLYINFQFIMQRVFYNFSLMISLLSSLNFFLNYYFYLLSNNILFQLILKFYLSCQAFQTNKDNLINQVIKIMILKQVNIQKKKEIKKNLKKIKIFNQYLSIQVQRKNKVSQEIIDEEEDWEFEDLDQTHSFLKFKEIYRFLLIITTII